MLNKTLVVGLFKNMTDADRVVSDLEAARFSRDSIKIVDAHEMETHEQLAGHKRGWFRRLFSAEEPIDETVYDVEQYSDWVRKGGVLVVAKTDESSADRAVEIMKSRSAAEATPITHGRRMTDMRTEPLHAMPKATTVTGPQYEQTIPVLEEELRVGKRQVQRKSVRVVSHVVEKPVEESINLHDEKVIVERHPVDRIATDSDLRAFHDSTVEMTETIEEPVVSKEAHVKEEVTVSKKITEHQEKIRDSIRSTEVEIKDLETGRPWESEFRRHFNSRYGKLGKSYSDYSPAYELGSTLASDERYRNRDWNSVESEARRQWEAKRSGDWNDFRDAIRQAWDTIRGRRAA